MGLDATVRCRCFEEGKLKPGPIPAEDLYVDEEGYISSLTIDELYKSDPRRFYARWDSIEDEFFSWLENCCEHEDGDYCAEWVSNWSGCARFQSLVEQAGGEKRFPLLSGLIPDGNGGIYPAEKAEATLAELDEFLAVIAEADQWVLCVRDTDEEIWTSTEGTAFTWMCGPFDEVGMDGGKVFFAHAGMPVVETTRFRQMPIGKPDQNGYQRMAIMCLDTDAYTETFDSIGPEGAPKTEREFYVAKKRAPFLHEGKYGTAERIRNLLVASMETGNPIRWC